MGGDNPLLTDKAKQQDQAKKAADYNKGLRELRKGAEKMAVGKDYGKIFRDAPSVTSASFTNEIANLRNKYGIPGDASGRGGWQIKGDSARRIDFYFTKGTGEKPVAYRMLDSLGRHSEAVAQQVKRLEGTKWGADPALSLVMTQRESTKAGFGSTSSTIDSYRQGGLDSLHQWQAGLKSGGYLPSEFPNSEKTPGRTFNELGIKQAKTHEKLLRLVDGGTPLADACRQLKTKEIGADRLAELRQKYDAGGRTWGALLGPEHEVFPARLPQNRVIEAYGAVLNERLKGFRNYAEKKGFTAEQLNGLSNDARRVWTTVFFVRPGDGKGLINRYGKEGRQLGDIIGDQRATRLHSVRRGLVNAAESELLEKKLGLPAPNLH